MRGLIALAFIVAATVASAQSITIDQQLWADMQRAVSDVSMPASAHQQVQTIFGNVQREAQMRAARAKAESEAKSKTEENK